MKSRQAHNVAKRVMAESDAPFICHFCDKSFEALGRRRGEGIVHHLDGDEFNNERCNLDYAHVTCHHRHHHQGVAKPLGFGDAVRKKLSGKPKTQQHRDRIAAATRRQFADPEARKRWMRARHGKGESHADVPAV